MKARFDTDGEGPSEHPILILEPEDDNERALLLLLKEARFVGKFKGDDNGAIVMDVTMRADFRVKEN